MRLPWRRPAVPAGVKASVDLGDDERVISIALSGEAAYVVATTFALYLLVPQEDPDQYGVSLRIRWDEIDKARCLAGHHSCGPSGYRASRALR